MRDVNPTYDYICSIIAQAMERILPVSWVYQMVLLGVIPRPIHSQNLVNYLAGKSLPFYGSVRASRLVDFLDYAHSRQAWGVSDVIRAWLVQYPQQSHVLVRSIFEYGDVDLLGQPFADLVNDRQTNCQVIYGLINTLAKHWLAVQIPASATACRPANACVMKSIWIKTQSQSCLRLIVSLAQCLPHHPDTSISATIVALDARLARFTALLPVSSFPSLSDIAWIQSYSKLHKLNTVASVPSIPTSLPKM